MAQRSPELFFVSPFHESVEAGGPRIDFHAVFKEAIVPACQDSGWRGLRGEAPFGAAIMDAVIAMLLRAELVVADVSLPNPNVFYELGLRHSLSAGATLVIAHRGTTLPFDIAHRQALLYDFGDLPQLRREIAAVLARLAQGERPSSPFRDAIERSGVVTGSHDQVAFEQDFNARIERAENNNQLIAVWQWARAYPRLGSRQLAVMAKRLAGQKNWPAATEVLERACAEHPADFELRRTLGWTLRKQGRLAEAERELREALRLNSADPEALGILGAILKGDRGRWEEARKAYQDAVDLSPEDNYVFVNRAAVELLLSPEAPAEGQRRYRALLDRLAKKRLAARDIWDELMIAEASFAVGEEERAKRHYLKALMRPDCTWQIDSALDQLKLFVEAGFRPNATRDLVGVIEDARRSKDAGQDASPRAGGPPEAANQGGDMARSPSVAPLTTDATPVIIHLSDLHFGERIAPDSRVLPMHRFGQPGSPKTLLDHLRREFSRGQPGRFTFDPERVFIAVSGDITYTGTQVEFKTALAFLEGLCQALAVPKERVSITPGNHDVNWSAAKYKAATRFDDYLIFVKEFYGTSLAQRLYPRIDWQLARDATIDPNDIFSVYTAPDKQLQIVTLNSCVHETEANHWGFVGETQLERISDVLDGSPGNQVRVAILHHHIHQYPEHHPPEDKTPWLDVSLVRDGGAVEAWLEDRGFDIVMHGHKHKPQLRQTVVRGTPQLRRDVRPLIICGAGSAGVHERELAHGSHNQYQVLEILCAPRTAGADFLRVSWRELPTFPGAKWSSSQEPWVLTG